MKDYLKSPQHMFQSLENKSSFSMKDTSKSNSAKRAIVVNDDVSSKRKKKDSTDTWNISSQIESIPNNPSLNSVLDVLFPEDKTTKDIIMSEAKNNFKIGLPYIIGERKVEKDSFTYDKAQEMAKLYIQLRNHERWPDAGFKAPIVDKKVFQNDRFFLFAGEKDSVISLGRVQEIEEKGLGMTDIVSLFRFSEFDKVGEHHLISIARLTFSFLLGENIIADSKGIDSSKFSSMLSEKEKTERSSDLMASAACDDGSPLFSLLLEKGVDPFRNSMLFDRTPAQMAKRDKAEKNLFLIEQFKKNGFYKR